MERQEMELKDYQQRMIDETQRRFGLAKTGWLEEYELAKQLGYTIDPQRRLGDPPSFRRSRPPQPVITIWCCIRNGSIQWACAELDNGAYTNHRYYDDLAVALETEAK